jgi:thiol reductant ABC exporter CydC subunit
MTPLALGSKALLGVMLGGLTILAAIGLAFSSNLLIVWAGFHPGIEAVGVVVVLVRFFGISRAVLRYFERLISHEVTFLALARLRVWLFDRLEPLSASQWLGARAGENFRRMMGDVEILQMAWLRGIAPMLVALLTVVLSLLMLLGTHLHLALVALAGYTLAGLFVPWLLAYWTQQTQPQLEALHQDHSAELYDHTQGALELYLMGATERVQDKCARVSQQITNLSKHLGLGRAMANAAAQIVAWLTTLVLVWVAPPLELPSVLLAAMAIAVLASFEAILPLATAQNSLNQSLLAWQRIKDLAYRQPLVRDLGWSSCIPTNAKLEFCDVGVRFAEQAIFEHLSFSLEPQTWTMLLGQSGAGKTTVARLCLRLLEASSGQILLDGQPLSSCSLEALRNHISIVSQNGHVFCATVRQNLSIAKPDASPAQIWAALEQAGLLEVVRSLPSGLETQLENHAPLSSGERQRLLIARALLRDSPILILDEPTANLDATTQAQILAQLRRTCSHKTVLCITHRLETIEPSDRVIVLG